MNRYARNMIMNRQSEMGNMDYARRGRGAPYGNRNAAGNRGGRRDRAYDGRDYGDYGDYGDYAYDSRRGRSDRRDRDYDNRGYDRGEDMYPRYNERDGRDYGDYEDSEYSERDGRRGVKGTGRYGIGGSRYYGRRDRGSMPFQVEGEIQYDEEDYDYEDSDYGHMEKMRLTKRDMQMWKKHMENADGTKGEHFEMQQIMAAAEKLGIRFKEYDEKELCIATNMLYSDYCEALKALVPKDKEDIIYVKMAKAFLEDEDAPEGSEKLYLYFKCIVEQA